MDKYEAIKDVLEYCETNNITTFHDLCIRCKNEDYKKFKTIVDNPEIIIEYFK